MAVSAMVKLHRDEAGNVYGMEHRSAGRRVSVYPALKHDARPKMVESSGTKVILMGDAEDSNTCVPQDGAIWRDAKPTGAY